MKSFPRLFLIASLLLAAAAGAIAQDHAVNANVPFDFFVGDRFLPAGHYVLSFPYAGSIEIQSQDRRMTTFIVAIPGLQEPDHGSQLEFKKYGQAYFLHRVLCPVATGMNRVIPAGKHEKTVIDREAKIGDSSTVLVAAK
jgi:hypothetical protein